MKGILFVKEMAHFENKYICQYLFLFFVEEISENIAEKNAM